MNHGLSFAVWVLAAAAALPVGAQTPPEIFGGQIIVSPRGVEAAPFGGTDPRSKRGALASSAVQPVVLDADLLKQISQAAGIYVAPDEGSACPPAAASCKPTPATPEQINLRDVGAVGDVSRLVEVTQVDATAIERAIDAFNDTGFLLAVPNYWRRTTQASEPEYYLQWGFFDRAVAAGGANFEGAWTRTTGSSTVNVAVIDTGVVRSHPDLAAALVGGIDLVQVPLLAGDGDGYDLDATDPGDFVSPEVSDYMRNVGIQCNASNSSWHGTHVAGTIAGRINGAFGTGGAPNVNIVPVRVLGKCGGRDDDIYNALAWAIGLPVAGLPANQHPAHVVNMSLGGPSPCTPLYQQLFAEARRRGVVVVVAAGNSAHDTSGFSPAGCPDVISVAAHDRAGMLAPFSNFGFNVAVSAPGVDVLSAVDLGTAFPIAPGTAQMSGTSMAAPHVSAAAALLKSALIGVSLDEVRQYLHQSAGPFLAGSGCGAGEPLAGACGAGYLDTDRLLAVAGVAAPQPPDPPPQPPEPPPVVVGPSPGESSSGCFIATAAFGSEWHEEVRTLRRFRDDVLLPYAPGRAFVRWYYRVSPGIADVIRGSDLLRTITRAALRPVVIAIEQPLLALLCGGLAVRWMMRVARSQPRFRDEPRR